ncbi:SprB-like repeat protein, partial [Arcicella aurantiaca]
MKKDYTNQTLTKGSFAVSCLLLIFKILSGQIKDYVRIYFCNRKNKLIHYVSSILILLLLNLMSNTVQAQVGGKVFKDFNANSAQETSTAFTEPGIAGVTVTAYNTAGAVVGTATTATDGSYTITGASGNLRIEFTNFPVGIYEGPLGAGSQTSVQFVTAPTTTASLGINCPEDYCNTANPKLVTVCYDNGSGVGNTNPVVVGINYTATGSGSNTYPTNGTADNMGSVWGIAYDKHTKLSYFSAFLKRQAGLGDRGLDGIYVVNYSSATPILVGGFDLEGVVPSNGGSAISFGSVTRNLIASGSGTGVNDLSADRTQASRDADAYAKVGKVGYGDIDIDQLRNTLWAVNLNERSLVEIDISSSVYGTTIPTNPAATKVKRFFINGTTAPFISGIGTCPNGTMRPFGLKIHKDKGYLGTVCDGSSLTSVDLTVNQKAYVYSFDLVNPTSFTEVTSVPLNYNREESWVPFAPTATFDALESDQWQRWIDTYTDPTTFGGTVNSTNADFKTGINGLFVGAPQPILSDIEFLPNGDMVLGFMDRFAHQQGWGNYIPSSSTVLRSAVSHGDILLASKTATGFVYEGPNENDNFTTPAVAANAQPGQELNDGPSGAGEFFYKDYYIGSDATHPETALGGLAILPGSNEVTAISFDPAAFNSMGVRWFNYNTGNESRNYTIVANTNNTNFGKGSALGDVELLCNLAPIEIGNRVWKDTDKDGIQDPGEPALVGVTLVLYNSSGVAVDTTVTDANGNYVFSSAIDPDVLPNTSYRIRLVNLGSNASVSGLALTDITVAPGETSGTNTGLTLANNDAFLSSSLPTINVVTGTWGENNHTYDIGLVACTKPSLTFSFTKATCTNGVINNNGSLTVNPVGADKIGLSFGGTSYGGPTYAYAATNFTLPLPNKNTDSTKVWIRVFAGLDRTGCYRDTSFVLPPTICPIPKPCNASAGQIGGNVFRDFNNTGTKDTLEVGLAGIPVKVFDCNGTLLGTTVTDAFGNYSFTGMPAGQVRVEFGTIPAPYKPSKSGTDNATTTQFATAPDCTVDLGVNDPNEYCQKDPNLATVCYVVGNPLAVGFPTNGGANDALVTTKYDFISAVNHDVKYSDMGSTWGISYNKLTQKLFTSAWVKRHTGLGALGAGGIYVVDYSAGDPSVTAPTYSNFLDLATLGVNVGTIASNTARGLTGASNVASMDSAGWYATGKVGLGDIDISDDYNSLFTVSLASKKVVKIDLTSYNTTGVKPTAGNVTTLPDFPNTACTGGESRPFGLKYHQGKLYLGVVCDGSVSGLLSDVKATVYAYDFTTSSWSTAVNTFPLDYRRGAVHNSGCQFWIPWSDDPAKVVTSQGPSFNGRCFPQPLLSDIEFDVDGSMVLGFADRGAHMMGAKQPIIDNPATLVTGVNGGDILRVYNNNGTYVLENGGTTIPGGGAGYNFQGPGNGEYYADNFPSHQNTSLGGLAILAGSNEVVYTSIDPTRYESAGYRRASNTTGQTLKAMELYYTPATGNGGTFNKGAGLGDVELLCNIQPIEIGNRLWLDLDNDGVQDPCENPLANVSVSLYDKLGNLVAQTTTDANGTYYFNEANVVDTVGTTKPNILGPQANTDYFVVVGKEDASFDKTKSALTSGSAKLSLTVANSTQSNGNDQNDSDGLTSGVVGIPSALNGYPAIAVKTPLSGSDHTYDFGFTCKPVITATPKKQTVCGTGTASAFTRKIKTGFVSSQQWYGPLADTTSAFTTKIAGAVDSTYTPSTLPAAGQTRYYAVIARNGDSLCADTAFVALTVSPKIVLQATPTNALCNAGGGSISTTVSGGTTPYTYLWSNGATTSSITNVVAGSYQITVTDAAGCTKDTNLVITQPDSLSLSLSTMNVTCNAGTDGGLASMLSGGKAPYNYEWYNGVGTSGLFFSNNPSVTGLTAGTYTLKVIDANGCFKTKTVTVTQPIKINVAQSQKDNICFDQSKGEVYVKIGGGTPPITIKWNVDGVYKPAYDGLDTLRNLKAGIYELVLTDANGCTTTVKDTLVQPDSLHIAFTKTDGLCSNGNKGSINTTVTGGVSPYSYSWSNAASTANVSNLATGNYKLVVTDAKGCKDSITVFIDEEDCRVDVALKKTVDGVCERKVGDLVTFKVVVSRQDTTSQTTTVIVKDQISSDFLVTSSTPTKGTFDVSTGLWSGIALAKGDSATLTVTATIKAGAAGLICNQAHVDFMDKLDTDSQAGNVNPVEDDIAFACVSVPINLCKADGQSVTLTTPDSLTSIKWFKDGTELTAEAGKSSITVSDAGSYTYTGNTISTSCPVGTCCPVIIKDACYGSIGDYVWNDNNINGKQDGGETPVAGVKVYLLNGTTGAKLDSAITDINGKYLFDSLLSGSYKVQFVEPVGKDFTTLNTGGDSALDSDAGTNGTSDLITIDTTKPSSDLLRNNLTIDAGIIPQFGSIGDYVWTDQNNDGQQTAGELPIAGVKVYLYENLGGTLTLIDSTLTNVNGKYLFDSLLDGLYQVKFVAPIGTIPAKQNSGADVSDSDANKSGYSQDILIDTTKPTTDTLRNNPQIDAGFVPVGSIGDYVFADKNGNGTQEATDTPIAGIKVYLLDSTTGAKLDSTITDTNGKYLFDSLVAGNYKVQFVIPAGSEATTKGAGIDPAKDSNANPDGTTDAVTIDTTQPLGSVARDNMTVDAGIVPAYGSIGDYVWTDQNNDGQQTAGELPIAGVKVYLYDGTGTTKLDSTVTDATGK